MLGNYMDSPTSTANTNHSSTCKYMVRHTQYFQCIQFLHIDHIVQLFHRFQ